MDLPADRNGIYETLLKMRSPEEITELVYNQLFKDVTRAGLELPFSKDLPPEMWTTALSEMLASADSIQRSQLIYLADLPEQIEAFKFSSADLAETILYREFVKIYYRLCYFAKD